MGMMKLSLPSSFPSSLMLLQIHINRLRRRKTRPSPSSYLSSGVVALDAVKSVGYVMGRRM
jgi:hypothetical protein